MLRSLCVERFRFLFFAVAFANVAVSVSPSTASAHIPHDVIRAIAISPSYAVDQTVFMLARNNLLRSQDGGVSWKNLIQGLDNVHPPTSLAISSTSNRNSVLFLATDGDGVYRSVDNGSSWSKANEGLSDRHINLVAMAPSGPDGRALAAGRDGGLFVYKAERAEWSSAKLGNAKITAISFHPLDHTLVVAGDQEGSLYRSTDGGTSWHRDTQLEGNGSITALVQVPDGESRVTLFVGDQSGFIFRSDNGDNSYVNLGQPSDKSAITALSGSPNTESGFIVLATTWDGEIVRSTDRGATWKSASAGTTKDDKADALNRKQLSTIQIAASPGKRPTMFAGGYDGLFRSQDGADSWIEIEVLPAGLIVEFDFSPQFEKDGSVALTTYGGGMYISQNWGATWKPTSIGLTATRHFDIAFSPGYQSDSTIVSSMFNLDLAVSNDQGTTWSTRRPLDQRPWLTWLKSQVRSWAPGFGKWLAKAKSYWSNRLQVGHPTIRPGRLVLSPRFVDDRTMFLTSISGVYRSTDGGLTATALWKNVNVRSLLLSPAYAIDRTVFLSTEAKDGGVFKSTDRGETWQRADSGIKIKSDRIHLAISPGFAADQTLFAATVHGLFRSVDGGASWQDLSAAIAVETSVLDAIALSPDYAKDGELIVSAKGHGLFKSKDGGMSFVEIGRDLRADNQGVSHMYAPEDELTPLKFSPAYGRDHKIFLSSTEDLFMSSDGGEIWRRLSRPVRYENINRSVLGYVGEWQAVVDKSFSAISVHASETAGSRVDFRFVGSSVVLIGTRGPDLGIAKLRLDGDLVAELDLYAPTQETAVPLHTVPGLEFGPHRLTIEVAAENNPLSEGHWVHVDAFDVTKNAVLQ